MTSTCPRCGSPIDPWRARAVRIVGGRVVAFCSVVCRDAWERGPAPVAPPDPSPPDATPAVRQPEPAGGARQPGVDSGHGSARPDRGVGYGAPATAPAVAEASRTSSVLFWALLIAALGALTAALTLVAAGRLPGGSGTPHAMPPTPPRARPAPPPPETQPAAPDPQVLRESAERALRLQIAGGTPVVRLRAAAALAPTRAPEAVAELERALEDRGWPRRLLAAAALVPVGHEPARRLLRGLVTAREPREGREVRLEAARILARAGDPAGRALLRRALATPGQRLGAAEALARLGDPEGLQALREVLASGPAHTRVRAAVGLAASGERNGLAVLEAAIRSDRLHVGAAAVLSRRGDARARARLVEALDRAALRVEAARGLRESGPLDRAELAALWRALGAGDELARVSAAEAVLCATAPEPGPATALAPSSRIGPATSPAPAPSVRPAPARRGPASQASGPTAGRGEGAEP